ncbi:MAG: PEP-CTERM sorting domain-containing protein [Armatimonadota bacterium]
MKILSILAATALVVSAGAATASTVITPYTGAFNYTWDFTNGTANGWTMNGASPSNGGGFNAIYAPDATNATFDATTLGLNLGGVMGKDRFVIQADVYVGAANYLQGSGIGAKRSDTKGPWIAGTAASSQGMGANDKSWFNSTKNKSWGLAVGQWVTVQLDYGYTDPGFFSARYTVAEGNGAGWPVGSWAECITLANNAVVHPSDSFNTLALGGGFNGAQAGWCQAYYKNFKLAVVPEPGSMLALGSGLIGLFGMVCRRK